MVLLDSGTLTVGDSTSTVFDGSISGAGGVLIKQGSGELVLSGTNTYDGGTEVDDGTLSLATPDALAAGTSLIVGTDAASIFGLSLPAASLAPATATAAAVPEPGTLALLVGGGVGCGFAARRTRKRH